MDGCDTLLNEAQKECEYRNEFACARLQLKTHDDDTGNNWVNESDQTIKVHLALNHTKTPLKTSYLSLLAHLSLIKRILPSNVNIR